MKVDPYALFCIELGAGHHVYVFVIYGYTGGHANKVQASRTSKIVRACTNKLDAHPQGPAAICGDVNADVKDIPSLAKFIQAQGWIDLGGSARFWGRMDNDFTCTTSNCSKPTRRDYVSVNPELLPLVTNFEVFTTTLIPHMLL